ncbi:acyl carrier protein [Aquirufa nivalisilvae]
MEQRLKQIMANVFNLELNQIHEDISPETIENWDSIAHLNLVTSIEEEFEITFSEDQIAEMLNYKLILLLIDEILNSNKLS